MASAGVEKVHTSGFDFGNSRRNQHIHAQAAKSSPSSLPKATSTGTTIVGCLFDGGVVLGADTRATEGSIVADKNCEKIHYITDNIRCAGAGTAADTEFTTQMISSNLQLHSLNTGRKPRVSTAMTMLKQYLFQYQGHIGAYLVVGGIDATGPHLFTVHAHGSVDKLPYVTMGSGSLAAMAVFERGWREGMTQAEATELVADAIEAGVFNDLGSGSNVDVCVILPNETNMTRGYRKPNERSVKESRYTPRPGTTEVKKVDVRKLVVSEEVKHTSATGPSGGEGMDIDK